MLKFDTIYGMISMVFIIKVSTCSLWLHKGWVCKEKVYWGNYKELKALLCLIIPIFDFKGGWKVKSWPTKYLHPICDILIAHMSIIQKRSKVKLNFYQILNLEGAIMHGHFPETCYPFLIMEGNLVISHLCMCIW